MSVLTLRARTGRDRSADVAWPTGDFGAGDAEPYERALRAASARLTMHDVLRPRRRSRLDVSRYLAAPSPSERRLLGVGDGPVLDVGCGPGRMVQAALLSGRPALGIDLSATSIAIALARRLPAVHGSVFDRVPDEGSWGTVLLMDGNIGIGGDQIGRAHV